MKENIINYKPIQSRKNYGLKKTSEKRKKNRGLFLLHDDGTWTNIMENDITTNIDNGTIKEGDFIIIPRTVRVVKNHLTLIDTKTQNNEE